MLQNRYRRQLRGNSEATRRQLGGNSEVTQRPLPPFTLSLFHFFTFLFCPLCRMLSGLPLRPLVRDCILRLTLFIVRDFIPYISACRLLGHSFTLSFFHSFILSFFHSFTLSLFHSFILSLFHSFILSHKSLSVRSGWPSSIRRVLPSSRTVCSTHCTLMSVRGASVALLSRYLLSRNKGSG